MTIPTEPIGSARQRSEAELLLAKEALELKTRELASSLALIRATLESTTDGILVTDSAGIVKMYNRKYAEMWKMPPEILESGTHGAVQEVAGRLFANPGQFSARIREIYETSPPETYDVLELAEGRVIERFSRIQFVDERNAGRVWSFREVTETWRQLEAHLRMSAIVESSDDAIISKNLDGVIVSWNKGAERLYGYTEEEAVGKPVSILIPPDHEDELPMILDRLKRGERVERFETVRMHKDGGRIEVSVTISPVRSSRGVIVGASKIARDITLNKRVERISRFLADASAALVEVSDYKSALEQVARLAVPGFADWCVADVLEADGAIRRLAVVHRDPAKVRLANELYRRYPPRPTDPNGAMRVLRTGQPQLAAAMSEEMLAASARDESHLRLLRQLKLKSLICVPLRSREKMLGSLTFLTAESGRVFGGSELAAAEDLAHRAVIAIENSKLLAALRETDRRKDEFLAILAHELRNPLAPIRNAVQILRRSGPPLPALQWTTDVIDRQVHQMTRLVDDLLDVSRITRGKTALRKERVDLATVITSAIEASHPLIAKLGHKLTVTITPQHIRLDADPTRLAQVFLNLLNNAAKYMNHGGQIWMTADLLEGQVVVRVKDAGIGIPSETLPRIFEMFMQVDRSLERSDGGLGIGLTLVQRLVEMHGGSVEVRSDGPDRGSEFIVRLPAASEAEPNDGGESGGPVIAAPPCGRRILVVDDNEDAANSLGMLLRLMGNDVDTAHDGLDAVGKAAAFRPEVILLDIGLPKLNGYDAARRIRAEAGGDEIMLVALTGWGQDEDRHRSREAGFDHHMTKPIELAVLQELLAANKPPSR